MIIKLVHTDCLSVEATVRRAGNGDLLLFCTCGGCCEPDPGNRVYMFRSGDNGNTWSEKQQIHEEDGAAHYQTATAVIGGEIRVFISRHDGRFLDWTNYYLSSYDNGMTWKKHDIPCLPEYAFVRDMTLLSDGRMIFPYHFYPVTEEQVENCRANNKAVYVCDVPYVETGLLVSSDGGATLQRQVAFLQTREELRACESDWTWPEQSVIELEPGHLIMVLRMDMSGCLWRTDSWDGGATWETPRRTDIPNPPNKPQLLKTAGGDVVLVNTPSGQAGEWRFGQRQPLEIWLSRDGMNTWYKKIRVSDFPGAYSYANGFIEHDGHMRLAFEFNRHDIYYVDCDLKND